MSTPVWCEIVCNECASTATGQFTYAGVPRKALEKSAESEGFKFIDGEPYCRRCAQRKNRKA